MNNISIRVKVLVPIVILSIVIMLSNGFALLNERNLLNTSYVISDECSDNIEILMEMESTLQSIGKNMYGHCKAENATTKNEYENNIKAQISYMEELFSSYESKHLTKKEQEYVGAMRTKFDKYIEGVNEVLAGSMDEDNDAQRIAINVKQKPAEDYLNYKINRLIDMRKAEMENALLSQQKAYRVAIVSSVLFFAIALLMSVFAFVICNRGIVRPMHYISNKLDKMIRDIKNDEGDLSMRINITGKDEIGVIGGSVNGFIETLQNVMQSITESSKEMNNIVNLVGKKITLSDDNARDISAAMEELSAGSDELLSYTDKMEQSALGLKNNAIKNKNEASNMTQAIISKLQEAMEESKQVEQIKQLTNDILNIASQTNLLALNASIEAARAGEAGRGFSVVASEISQLSDSSRDTATHIQDINNLIIDAVRQLTNHANELVNYIEDTILPDYDSFVEAGMQYSKDANHVNEIVNQFHMMSDELRSQTEQVQEFAMSITNSVQESSEGIQIAASNTENLSGEIAGISGHILENKEVANILNREAERFII